MGGLVTSCGQEDAASGDGPDATGALTGKLRSYIFDGRDGKSRRLRDRKSVV